MILAFKLIGFMFFVPFSNPLEAAIASKVFEPNWPLKPPFKMSTCTFSATVSQSVSSFLL